MVNKMPLAMPLKVIIIIVAVLNILIGLALSIQVHMGDKELDGFYKVFGQTNKKGNGLMVFNIPPFFLLGILSMLYAFLPYIAFPIINLVVSSIGILLNFTAGILALGVLAIHKGEVEKFKTDHAFSYDVYVQAGVMKHAEDYWDWLGSYTGTVFIGVILLIATIIIMGLALCRCCSRQQAGAEKEEDIEDGEEETISFE